VVTVPASSYTHSETLAALGLTPASVVLPSLAAHADTDENSEELLDLVTLTAKAGTGTVTVSLAFATPTTGPIRVNYIAS
jgi:hypothetical protein